MLEEIITSFVSAMLGALAAILIARYSKTKQERDSGLASDYLKIADMSGEQLEKRINLITQLEKRLQELEVVRVAQEIENAELKARRDERDEKIEALEARIAALDAQLKKDTIETRELHEKYERLKAFTENLIAALEKKGIKLPELNGTLPDSIRGFKREGKE